MGGISVYFGEDEKDLEKKIRERAKKLHISNCALLKQLAAKEFEKDEQSTNETKSNNFSTSLFDGL